MTQPDPKDVNALSNELRLLVRDQGLSFEEIAKNADVSIGTVHNFVHGNISKPHVNTINKLKKYLQKRHPAPSFNAVERETGFSSATWLTGVMPQISHPDAEESYQTYISPGISRPPPGNECLEVREQILSFLSSDTSILNVIVGETENDMLIVSRFFFYDYKKYTEADAHKKVFAGELFYRFNQPSFLAFVMTTLAFCDFNNVNRLQSMRPVDMVEAMVNYLCRYSLLLLLDTTAFTPTDKTYGMFWQQLFAQDTINSRIILVSTKRPEQLREHYSAKNINLQTTPPK